MSVRKVVNGETLDMSDSEIIDFLHAQAQDPNAPSSVMRALASDLGMSDADIVRLIPGA